MGGAAVADLGVEGSDLIGCVCHLSVHVMEYPVGSGDVESLGKVIVSSELEFERCVQGVRGFVGMLLLGGGERVDGADDGVEARRWISGNGIEGSFGFECRKRQPSAGWVPWDWLC